MTSLTHNYFLCIYFNSLHVSSKLVLIISSINCINTTYDMSPTHSDMYQRLYWYNWYSWWWARGCSKHVENWNTYIENNCASSWSFTMNHNRNHGQQNIIFSFNLILCCEMAYRWPELVRKIFSCNLMNW